MSRGRWFLTVEYLKSSLRHGGSLIGWALATAAVLATATALFVLPDSQNPRQPYTQAFLLARLATDLSEAEIAQLGSEVWAWPEVEQVVFRFPGEADPVPVAQRTLLVHLSSGEARASVQGRLSSLKGVAGVEFFQRTVNPPPRLPPISRILALAGLVSALVVCLWLGYRTSARTGHAWQDELALLRSAGVSEASLRVPFLALGGLVGLGGAVIYLAAYWALWGWGQGIPAVQEVAPGFLKGEAVATWLGLLAGVGLGVLGGAVGYPSSRPHS
ncbi:hypothetical protein H5T53_03105 [Candidatus Bipolaricaulota bacterium]|nr:hypothetical protein [Candidatus Bipolaricaulota bacterium]